MLLMAAILFAENLFSLSLYLSLWWLPSVVVIGYFPRWPLSVFAWVIGLSVIYFGRVRVILARLKITGDLWYCSGRLIQLRRPTRQSWAQSSFYTTGSISRRFIRDSRASVSFEADCLLRLLCLLDINLRFANSVFFMCSGDYNCYFKWSLGILRQCLWVLVYQLSFFRQQCSIHGTFKFLTKSISWPKQQNS
jgi:hypothetical protein